MTDAIYKAADVTAVILAGGAATRMGGVDKGLVDFNGRAMVETVIDRIRPQTAGIVISANRSIDEYSRYGCPVVKDEETGYPGPLMGILSALKEVKTEYAVVVPCDSPFIPMDYVKRLREGIDIAKQRGAKVASVICEGVKEPVFMMIAKDMAPSVRESLAKGDYKVRFWLETNGVEWTPFDDLAAFDNLNTKEDVEKAQTERKNP